MNFKNKNLIRLDKTAFSVTSSFDDSETKSFWLSKTPHERLEYVEILRRMNYGNKATARLQRILEVTERP
jgi:hypothetical protein